MFFFGDDTSLVVDYYINKANDYGPRTPSIPYSEMGETDMVNTYIRARIAYRLAQQDEVDEKILSDLTERILDTFRYAVALSDELAAAPYGNAFLAVGASLDKYIAITEEVRHPSSAVDG